MNKDDEIIIGSAIIVHAVAKSKLIKVQGMIEKLPSAEDPQWIIKNPDGDIVYIKDYFTMRKVS